MEFYFVDLLLINYLILNMEIESDFSQLGLSDYPDKVNPKEVISVLENPNYKLWWLEGFIKSDAYHLICGYSCNKRILLIVACIVDTKRMILQVKVADEDDIKKFYCKA